MSQCILLRPQEAAPEIRDGLRSRLDLQFQRALESRTQGFLKIRGKGYVPSLQASHGVRRRRSGEGVVQRGPQTEKVRIGSETRVLVVLFRRRVLLGQDARVPHGASRMEGARRTEVDQHGAIVRQPDDVGGLDVAVQEIAPMHLL